MLARFKMLALQLLTGILAAAIPLGFLAAVDTGDWRYLLATIPGILMIHALLN